VFIKERLLIKTIPFLATTTQMYRQFQLFKNAFTNIELVFARLASKF